MHLSVYLPRKNGHNDLTIGGVHEGEKNLSDGKNEEAQIQLKYLGQVWIIDRLAGLFL